MSIYKFKDTHKNVVPESNAIQNMITHSPKKYYIREFDEKYAKIFEI